MEVAPRERSDRRRNFHARTAWLGRRRRRRVAAGEGASLARRAGPALGRYKALSGERDPRIGTLMKVLDALGAQLTVVSKVA